jgi:pre-mRNA-splicing factor CWC26
VKNGGHLVVRDVDASLPDPDSSDDSDAPVSSRAQKIITQDELWGGKGDEKDEKKSGTSIPVEAEDSEDSDLDDEVRYGRMLDSSSESDESEAEEQSNAVGKKKAEKSKMERVRQRIEDSDSDLSDVDGKSDGMVLMSDGTRAGLLTNDDLKVEEERIHEEEEKKFSMMDPEETGRDAEVVYRDKEGNIVDEKTAKRLRQRGRILEDPDDELHPGWRGGLIQKEEGEKIRKKIEQEAHKPFAQYEDDEELNVMQMEVAKEEDPMNAYMEKKKKKRDKKRKKAEGIVERKRYTGPPPPPNRFGIVPGWMWDGIDRSNGFETKFLRAISQAKDRQSKEYKATVEDW